MQGNVTIKRIVAAWVTICMIVSSLGVMIAVADNDEQLNSLEGMERNGLTLMSLPTDDTGTTGSLEFKGFELKFVKDSNGDNTIQALVDVYVHDVDPTGIDFTLKFDKNFIVPSDYATNDEFTTSDASSSYESNSDYFSAGDISAVGTIDQSTIGGVTSDILWFYIQPNDTAVDTNPYIDTDTLITGASYEQEVACIKATSITGGMKIGTLSFKIKKPNQVVSTDPTDPTGAAFLASILSLYDDGVTYSGSGTGSAGGYIVYIDNAALKEYFVGVLNVVWNVNDTLYSVESTMSEATVSAYNIYTRAQTGTVDDLIMYLNQTMGNIFLNYTSGVQRLGKFIWDKTDPSFSITPDVVNGGATYNPLGGVSYVITQYYNQDTTNENMKISIKVNVTPVTVTGLLYDNKVQTYIDPTRPATWADLNMPEVITPVLDGVDDMYIVPTEKPVKADWNPTDVTETLKSSPAPVTQTYTHTFDKTLFGSTWPVWLTEPAASIWDVEVLRNVLPSGTPVLTDADNVTAYVDRVTGKLIITVPTLGGNPITTLPDFRIYLPDGTVLGTLGTENGDFVTAALDGTKAVITINTFASGVTSKTTAELQRIQSIINLGSEDFKLSSLYNDGAVYYESSLVPFKFNQRTNFYLPENNDGSMNYDEKNYSQSKMNMFPIYEGSALTDISTYIAFPDNQTIPIRYHGQDGYQITPINTVVSGDLGAEISAAKVDSWLYWEDVNDSSHTHRTDALPVYDTDIYLVGLLSDYSYSNFGSVQNPDSVYLKLKLTTQVDPSVTPTPDPNASPSPSPTIDPSASPTPTVDPSASPSPSSSPTATPGPTATPQPKEAIRILTMAHGTLNGVYNNGGIEVEVNDKTFEYDTKKVGYSPSEVQTQVYKIENIGSSKLQSPQLRLADFTYTPLATTSDPNPATVSGPISYIIGNNGIYTDISSVITPNILELNSGGDAYFDIRTKCQLPTGVYTAKVYVGSLQKSDLASFTISFKVVDRDVYRVTVKNNDVLKGKGYLMNSSGTTIYSNTYQEGDTVNLYTEIVDIGYTLKEWQDISQPYPIPNPDTITRVTFNSNLTAAPFPTTFTMPDRDVTVTPVFEETIYNLLRPSDLRDYSSDITPILNDLRPDSISSTPAPYSETTFKYYVIVEGDKDKNYIELDLKPVSFLRTVTMTLTNSAVTAQALSPDDRKAADANGVYIWSKVFDLEPGENTVVIRISDASDPLVYQEYTVVIYRKQNVDVEMRPGNSPVGLIYGSDNIPEPTPSVTPNKDTVAADFAASGTNYYTYDPAYTPDKAVNTMFTRYSTAAWTGTNYDLDKTALFVYQGDKFVDPGYSHLKKAGTGVDVQPEEVTRTIKNVYVYTPNYTDPIAKVMKSATLYNTTGDVTVASKTAKPANYTTDGQCLIEELASLNVRPGVYMMEYSFTDSDGSTATFQRPIIMLAPKGDVNLSGTVDRTVNASDNTFQSNDADILYQRMNDTTGPTAAPSATAAPGDGFFAGIINNTSEEWAQLFAYRIADVTEDIDVNSIDANAVLNKYEANPSYTNATVDITLRQYYEKLPDTLTSVMPTFDPTTATTAPTAVPVPTTTPKPVLTLDYLGVGSQPQDEAQTPNLTQTNEYGALANKTRSIVWVGVGIRNTENLEYFLDGLYSVDISIDYDPDIFEPCDASNIIQSESTTFISDLQTTIEDNNFNNSSMTGVTTSHKTLWLNADVYTDSLQSDLQYPHANTADDKYKTLFVTIKSPDGKDLRLNNYALPSPSPGTTSSDETVYLLRVPFRLVKYPNLDDNDPNKYTGLALDLNLTENTFVLGATANGVMNSASWEGNGADKTTAVNNAFNHFDLDITDIFDTGSEFLVKGKISGWNPKEAFEVSFYKTDSNGDIVPASSPIPFISHDPTSTAAPENGTLTIDSDGFMVWDYELAVPVLSGNFNYAMVITKKSHLQYPPVPVPTQAPSATTTDIAIDDIDLIVGDIDENGYIKIPDRVGLIRLFNEQKPWWDTVFPQTDPRVLQFKQEYEEADLNGDDTVNLFDLNLLNSNMDKDTDTYATPSPTAAAGP